MKLNLSLHIYSFFFLIVTSLFQWTVCAQAKAECRAVFESKQYIDADFQAPYPKTISYKCKYECRDLAGDLHEVVGYSSLRVSSLDEEGKNLVCQGVVVEKAKWGYEYRKTESFFAYNTKIKELKKWARNQNIPVDTEASQALLEKSYKDLAYIYSSYNIAGQNSDIFKEASEIISTFFSDINNIDHYIEKLKALNYEIPRDFSTENLVLQVVAIHFNWRNTGE